MSGPITGKGLTVNEETGYLEAVTNNQYSAFDSEAKKQFLEEYEKTGNMTAAIKNVGFTQKTMYDHLKLDKRFSEDFNVVRRSQKHRLEGVMFENALTPKGFMDRIAWLRKNFPDEYSEKRRVEHTTAPKLIDSLYSSLTGKEILEAEIVTDKPTIG